jgi:1-aminocyclopropane-1-carboxylate deaminase
MLSPLLPGSITVDDITHLFDKPIQVAVLRLDKLHAVISGNKWFKLRYYLEEAKAQHKKNIVTFGGAWSNHIIATAAACKMNGLKAVGIIRGEQPAELTETLLNAKDWGMRLVFIPRSDYRDKYVPDELLTKENYLINEGGYGVQGARGAATILDHCPKDFTHYCCAAGTGTMTAGLVNATAAGQKIIGISVMKNNRALKEMIASLIGRKEHELPAVPVQGPVAAGPDWQLIHEYHFDGYAKYQPQLLQFMNDFYLRSGIPSDFVYTGKLFYAITDLVQKDFFSPGSRLLVIHSGGLQGNASLRKGTLMF